MDLRKSKKKLGFWTLKWQWWWLFLDGHMIPTSSNYTNQIHNYETQNNKIDIENGKKKQK